MFINKSTIDLFHNSDHVKDSGSSIYVENPSPSLLELAEALGDENIPSASESLQEVEPQRKTR